MIAEEQFIRDSLTKAVAGFAENPMNARIIRRFASEAPGLFAPVAVAMLLTAPETAGYRYLALLLVRQPALFHALSNPSLFTRDQAVTLARKLMNVEPSLDVLLARQLPNRSSTNPESLTGAAAERALDVLDEISPGRRLVPILSHLTRYPDRNISSKSTMLVGKRLQNDQFARRLIAEGVDPRVRANAIEAVWGMSSPEIVALFRDCLQDQHNRVVANALFGLFLAGQEDISALVKQFAKDAKSSFRMSSAWTMGKIGDPEFVPFLTALIRDDHPGVRRAALRSLQMIRHLEKAKNAPEPTEEELKPAAESATGESAELEEVELRLDGSHFASDRYTKRGRPSLVK